MTSIASIFDYEIGDDSYFDGSEPMTHSRIVPLVQGSDEWLAWRAEGIGASECAAALGRSRYSSPLRVWTEKQGLAPDSEQNENMEWGHRIEPLLVEKWLEYNPDYELDGLSPCVERVDIPWLRCSLDAVVRSRKSGLLEIQECKTASKMSEWEDDAGNAIIPNEYVLQGAHEMLVTGMRCVNFSVLVMGLSRRWISRRLMWDDAIHRSILSGLRYFWGLVESNTAPALSAGCPDADARAIAAINFGAREGLTIDGGSEAEELHAQYSDLSAQLKSIESRMDQIKNRIAIIGADASVLLANGKKIASHVVSERESIDSKRLKAELPDVAKKYSKTSKLNYWKIN